MTHVIYHIESGEILRRINVPHQAIAYQCSDSNEEFYLNCPDDATHIINNEPITIIPDPVPPTEVELLAAIVSAVQAKLDSVARSRNYDGILSLCSYVTSTDVTFAAEGQAGVAWRDQCWRYCYLILDDVKLGVQPVPNPVAVVAGLPAMQWPTG